MPSQPRYAIIENHSYFHVTWQCHNNEWLLKHDWAKQKYLELLIKYKRRYHIKIFSFCLMSNHPHLLGYCEDKKLMSDFFRIVNSQFAKYYNRCMKRRGQVVMDRFKSPRLQSDADLLKVMQYIDLNPKRGSIVKHPQDYRWSSYRYYAYGEAHPLLEPAPCYVSLASTAEDRQRLYREMVENILKSDWKAKKPYSSVPFIGDPKWCALKFAQLKEVRALKYQRYKRLRSTG